MTEPMLPPDPVDDVLRGYFQSQMPKPWPAAPRTAEPSGLAARRSESSNRARLTLAASVLILIGACWMFSGGPQPAVPGHSKPSLPGTLDAGSAKMPKEFEKPKTPMLD
jgi:hypothetical protein